MGRFVALTEKPILASPSLGDMAILPRALARQKTEFLPIFTPSQLRIGEDVYSYGYFAIGGDLQHVEAGYFGGKIVNFFDRSFTLPYAIIEGLSGSPVLTYHNGVKVVGMATGNRATRILAAETLSFKDSTVEYKETINRIVEFGTAMHCAAIAEFAIANPDIGAVISHERVDQPDLG